MPYSPERRRILHFLKQNPGVLLTSKQFIEILGLYDAYRRKHKVNRRVFCRSVLEYIAERMYFSKFSDSRYVLILLDLMFQDLLFLPTIPPDPDNQYTFLIDTVHHEYVGHFLNIAYREKRLFNGRRMACREVLDGYIWKDPIKQAAIASNPQLLRVFLRYGAAFLSCGCSNRKQIEWLDVVLNIILNMNKDVLPVENLNLNAEELEKYLKLICCCRLILCDVGRLRKPTLYSVTEDYNTFISKLYINVVPGYEKHVLLPLDLKQLCRLLIRRTLNTRMMLPRGIYKLPIPEYLKLYLDLCYD